MADKNVLVFAGVLALLALVSYSVLSLRSLTVPLLLMLALGGLALLFLSPRVVEFKEYERGVVFRLGRFSKVVGPGWVLLFPSYETYVPVDLRTRVIDTEPQHIETKDNVSVGIDAVSYIRITDPKKVVLEVKNLDKAITTMLVGEIRNTVAKMPLEQLMEKTEDINTSLISKLREVEENWGFLVQKAEVVKIELPPEIVEARHQARAAEDYKNKVETEARARTVTLDLLEQTASKMSDKTLAFLYLETLKKVADGRASKIIFPMELSQMASFLSSRTDPEKMNFLAKALFAPSQPKPQPVVDSHGTEL